MPGLPEYLQDWPEAQRTGEAVGLPWEDMKGRLMNQGLCLAPTDHVPPDVIYQALQREVAAGRGWTPQQLRPVGVRR